MALSSSVQVDDPSPGVQRSGRSPVPVGSLTSAVSWGAILAGAAAAASLSLILLMLGVGLGLSSVSPWVHAGVSATTLGVSAILWLMLTQLLASGMGGYLAGRLRTKWTEVHTDEVYFRDTAHGFLAWAVASLATAALLTSVIGSILGGGVQAGASAAGGIAASAPRARSDDGESVGYFVESLFRRGTPAAVPNVDNAASAAGMDVSERAPRGDVAEVIHIFKNFSGAQPLPPEDTRYIGQLVAQRTGLSPQDAEKRVLDAHAKAQTKAQAAEVAVRDAADKARKASAYGALWVFISLLIGAFIASLAATLGGRRRDA
jgi:hypothetical protein